MGKRGTEANAAWAAVEVARRGVTIAWISAVTNLLVVATAISIPYIQMGLEQQREAAHHQLAKVALIDASRSFIHREAEYRKLGALLAEAPDHNPQARIAIFERLANQAERRRQELLRMVEQRDLDLNFGEGIYKLLGVLETVEHASKEAAMGARLGMDEQFFEDIRRDFDHDITRDIQRVKSLIALNVDPRTGEVLPGTVRNCSDPGTEGICASTSAHR